MFKVLSSLLLITLAALQAVSVSAEEVSVPTAKDEVSLEDVSTNRIQTCSYSVQSGYFGGSHPNRFQTQFRRDEKINRIELAGWYVVDKIFIHASHHNFWIGRYQPTMASIDLDDDEELLAIRLCESMFDENNGNGPQKYIGHIMFVTTKGQVVKTGQGMDGECHHILFNTDERLAALYGDVGRYPSYLHSIGFEQWRGCQ